MKATRRPTIQNGVVYDIEARGGAVVSVSRDGVSVRGTFPAATLDKIAGMLAHVSFQLRRGGDGDPGLEWVQGWLYVQGFSVEGYDPKATA